MRVLVCGSYRHWNALEKHYVHYLSSMVEEVHLYPWPDIINDYYRKTLVKKFQYRYKVGVQDKIRSFNQIFLKQVQKQRPDIVWVFKGVDLWPETILRIKELGVKIVNYNPDHPFIRTFRSGGGQEIEDAIPLYDLIFSYSLEIIKEIENRYGSSIALQHLPFGYEISPNLQIKLDEIDLTNSEISRLCFIGNSDNILRYRILNDLIQRNIPIDIYGLGWNSYFAKRTHNARIFRGVYGDDYWLTLKKYRLQLNIFRPHNANSHNMRTFEIPAAGGIQLAPDSNEHRIYFKEGQEIFLYSSTDDLVCKAEMLLSLSMEEAQGLRSKAVARCLDSHYDYRHRADFVFQMFKKLLGEA